MKKTILLLYFFTSFIAAMDQPQESALVPTISSNREQKRKQKREERQQQHDSLLALAQSMIEQKKDLNAPITVGDFSRKTILTVAAQYRTHKQILELALANGADPNKLDGNNHSPLKIAVSAHSYTTFKYLVKTGLTVKDKGLVQEICGPWHDTLHKKKALKRVKMLNALLDNGASANELDVDGNTSLYHLLWKWIPIHAKHSKDLSEEQRDIFYSQRKEMITALFKAGLNGAHKNKKDDNAIDNIGKHPHLTDHQLQGFLFLEVQKNYAVKQ